MRGAGTGTVRTRPAPSLWAGWHVTGGRPNHAEEPESDTAELADEVMIVEGQHGDARHRTHVAGDEQ